LPCEDVSLVKRDLPQEGRTGPAWEVGTSGKGGGCGEKVEEGIWCQYCICIFVNGKKRPVETVPGMGEGNKGE
jgi:hypothetical protein